MSRVGIYSGTFDPIHEGHVLFAQVAAEQFGLDQIVFLPEPEPRFKKSVTPLQKRIEMARLATTEIEGTTVSESPPGPHTVSGVLEMIVAEYPDDDYFILLGQDVFESIGNWGALPADQGGVNDIKDSVGFIVGLHDFSSLGSLQATANEFGLNTRFVEVPLAALSSRNIRAKVKVGGKPSGLHDDVASYIEKEGLYS